MSAGPALYRLTWYQLSPYTSPGSITLCNHATYKLALDQLHELCLHRRQLMSDLFVVHVSRRLQHRISSITLTSAGHQHLHCTFSFYMCTATVSGTTTLYSVLVSVWPQFVPLMSFLFLLFQGENLTGYLTTLFSVLKTTFLKYSFIQPGWNMLHLLHSRFLPAFQVATLLFGQTKMVSGSVTNLVTLYFYETVISG